MQCPLGSVKEDKKKPVQLPRLMFVTCQFYCFWFSWYLADPDIFFIILRGLPAAIVLEFEYFM